MAEKKKSAPVSTGPVKPEDKKKALETALAQIEKNFGKGAIMRLGDDIPVNVEAISTGSLSLDLALGIGGVPRGRIVEIYGPESSGKTTLALHILASAQKEGGEVAFIDVEHALDPVYAEALGVDINDKIFGEIQRTFGGRLRLIITGAAAISPEVVKDFKTFGIPVYLGYGLTECSPLVIGNNDRIELPDSVGVPLPGVEAKIINADASGVGEICVKGPMVMLGYYNDPEATAEVLDEDGFFHTGDLGTVDENGYYRITGRIKNVIVTKNGKNIYPEEVEYYLNKNPFVAESIVVGEDEDDETMVTAKVFPNVEAIREKLKQSSVSSEEVFKALSNVVKEVNKKLPSYKSIKKLVVRETEFVKTTTQKIKRFAEEEKKERQEEQEKNGKDV